MRDDQLTADYLKRLRRAARTMPRARRRELLDEIAAHIAEARAAGAVPLQRVLGDLGDPKDIAATGSASGRLGVREVAAVVLLLLGGFIILAGWVVGLILLWASPRWRWPDKLLGTLVWPFGYAGVLYGLVAGAFANAANNAGSFCGYGCQHQPRREHAAVAIGPHGGGRFRRTDCRGHLARTASPAGAGPSGTADP